jgi:hypothetical protein
MPTRKNNPQNPCRKSVYYLVYDDQYEMSSLIFKGIIIFKRPLNL